MYVANPQPKSAVTAIPTRQPALAQPQITAPATPAQSQDTHVSGQLGHQATALSAVSFLDDTDAPREPVNPAQFSEVLNQVPISAAAIQEILAYAQQHQIPLHELLEVAQNQTYQSPAEKTLALKSYAVVSQLLKGDHAARLQGVPQKYQQLFKDSIRTIQQADILGKLRRGELLMRANSNAGEKGSYLNKYDTMALSNINLATGANADTVVHEMLHASRDILKTVQTVGQSEQEATLFGNMYSGELQANLNQPLHRYAQDFSLGADFALDIKLKAERLSETLLNGYQRLSPASQAKLLQSLAIVPAAFQAAAAEDQSRMLIHGLSQQLSTANPLQGAPFTPKAMVLFDQMEQGTLPPQEPVFAILKELANSLQSPADIANVSSVITLLHQVDTHPYSYAPFDVVYDALNHTKDLSEIQETLDRRGMGIMKELKSRGFTIPEARALVFLATQKDVDLEKELAKPDKIQVNAWLNAWLTSTATPTNKPRICP